MNDASRQLRYTLGSLCERYNNLIADKDALDFRLGSNEAYEETVNALDAEAAYLGESRTAGDELRVLIVEMAGVAQRIRDIEGF